MASNSGYPATSSLDQQVLETVRFDIDADIIQNPEFQKFIEKLAASQRVSINIDKIHEIISISGKKTAVLTSQSHIQQKIIRISSDSIKKVTKPPKHHEQYSDNTDNNPILQRHKIEPSSAKDNFLQFFGQRILDIIRKTPGISSADVINGKLQLLGDISTIKMIKSDLEQTLYEKKTSVTYSMANHLKLTCGGRLLNEFLNKHRVGSSLQPSQHHEKDEHKNDPNRMVRGNTRGSHRGWRGHHVDRDQYNPRLNNATDDVQFNHDQKRGGFGRGRGPRPNNAGHDVKLNYHQGRGGYGGGDGPGSNNTPRGQNFNRGQPRGQNFNHGQPRGAYGRDDGPRSGNAVDTETFKYHQQDDRYGGETPSRGQHGRGRFPGHYTPTHNVSRFNADDHAESGRNEQHNAQNNVYEYEAKGEDDNDDDNKSDNSDSDTSLASTFTNCNINSKIFNDHAEKSTEITLCSDSETSLAAAVAELQSYSLHVESWALTSDEFTFISRQQQQDQFQKNHIPIQDRCFQIKHYLSQSIRNYCVHVYVSYTRGMWYVHVRAFKADAYSAALKIKGHLNDVAETQVQIPISPAMAYFLKVKASSDIIKLEKVHNIKITVFSPPRGKVNDNEQDDSNDCLKLIGCISRINSSHMAVQNFLDSLTEQEQNVPCDTWDLARDISRNIVVRVSKIKNSDDYEAIGLVKFYESPIERRETTPKITFTIVGINEDMVDEIVQQCKDIIEGYKIWKLSFNEYRALKNILFVQKQPSLDNFQQEWDTKVQLDNQTNSVIIPARSKMIADEIKETLQNLAVGKPINRINRISVTIPVQLNIRRFVYKAIQPILDEARTQKVYVDTRNRSGVTLHGRSEVINSAQERINTTIKDIQQKLVTSPLRLPFAESELFRTNSYETVRRIERDTNTVIRDVKFTKKENLSNPNNNENNTNSASACVVNNRGQTILVKKDDITKIKDVDAIVNAANGSLNHAGGVDKAIADAAGPALDKECRQLIANNGGAPIPTGKAVKTTAGNLPYKGVIHAIGPQYDSGNQQVRPLLFASILASLRVAEEEGYSSIALPAISAATFGFPLQDCTNILIRAIKQFFADFPESNLRRIILIDIDDSVYNSFTYEVMKDHTNTVETNNDDIIEYDLPPLTVIWRWQDYADEKIYNDNDTRQIETAFQQYLTTFIPCTLILKMDHLTEAKIVNYSIHFREELRKILKDNPNALNDRIICGYQMREGSTFERPIIRYPLAKKIEDKSVRYHPKPLDIYHSTAEIIADDWEITGISNTAIKQAEVAIRKAIETATISKKFSVDLRQDMNAHEQAIRNIATQLLVKVEFEQDRTEKLALVLTGLQQNVSEAHLQIVLYANDVLRMENDKDDELSIPKEWGDQEDECKLVELPKNHLDFIRIENRMKETMKNMKIDKIERIQNLKLWNYYAFSRRTLRQQLIEKPDLEIEMELFHGTRATPPSEIYSGDCGFDMRFCTSGLWGRGSYFARNASYSCQNYSSKLDDTKRQVFLAHVLIGESYDYKEQNDQSLLLPPKKNQTISNARYNSVTGVTGGSRVYIIYDNRVTYPTFLITFS